ncbi:hypothetical protein BJV82DRAFT_674974 [Fennellomyces sp. T-0311]|nr:hypothetical protein BJV82DRAFT_674974 [Fennellomyces sp. T-0311]
MSNNSNSNNNNSTPQMPGFEQTRALQANRAALSFNQRLNELKDENAELRARLELVEATIARMSSVIAGLSAQPVASEAAPVVPLNKKQLREKYGSAKKKVVRDYVHEKMKLLIDGFDFGVDYRVSPNKETRKEVIEWVRLQPGSVDDPKFIDSIMKVYYDTLSRKSSMTAVENDVDLQEGRRNTRVTDKLKARRDARLAHATALEQEYPGGETVLVRECMSPELSDEENGVDVMHVLAPRFRTLKVKRYLDTLDEYVKASKKRKHRSSNSNSNSNSNSTGDDSAVMEGAGEEQEEPVVVRVPIRTGTGTGKKSYKRFVRRHAVSNSEMSGQLASTLPDWAFKKK